VRRKPIWIDLDNTPHVPFFRPVIKELEARGHTVAVTARDAFQVCELADRSGVKYEQIGRHSGKNKLFKVLGLGYRALQLVRFARRVQPELGLSHGSRSQIMACRILRVPSILIADYEFARTLPLMRPDWELVPEVVPADGVHTRQARVKKYPGIKEDVYVPFFAPDPALLGELGLRPEDLVVTVRPPATEAHYHNPHSETLLRHVMARLRALPEVRVVMLPRNKRQLEWMQHHWPEWFAGGRVTVPAGAVDGLNLLWYSDLAISGGGTMNREAAALGVPVYSIFRGHIGAVDHYLSQSGRLVLIESPEDVERKIAIVRRERAAEFRPGESRALEVIVEHVERILAGSARPARSGS
jgi:predicted glycosyltransferase